MARTLRGEAAAARVVRAVACVSSRCARSLPSRVVCDLSERSESAEEHREEWSRSGTEISARCAVRDAALVVACTAAIIAPRRDTHCTPPHTSAALCSRSTARLGCSRRRRRLFCIAAHRIPALTGCRDQLFPLRGGSTKQIAAACIVRAAAATAAAATAAASASCSVCARALSFASRFTSDVVRVVMGRRISRRIGPRLVRCFSATAARRSAAHRTVRADLRSQRHCRATHRHARGCWLE